MTLKQIIQYQVEKTLMEDFRFDYDHEKTPPFQVIDTAKKALTIISTNNLAGESGGNEGSGIQKAQSLVNREPISHAQLKRMQAFFTKNHEKVKQEISSGNNIQNSPLIQKWNLWGGDAGMEWVNRELGIHHDSNQRSKDLSPKGHSRLMDPHNTRTHSANHFFKP